jgi:hypothetical protein
MLKETKVAENGHVDGVVGDHPEGAIDVEVARMASENTADPDGLVAMTTIAGPSRGGADCVGESEV